MNDLSLLQRLLSLPPDRLVQRMFSSKAGSLSYAALADTALRVAGWLQREAGIGPGDRVALCLPKSLEAVQAVYAVMAAGAAFVPLPHQGPRERLQGILASMRPRLLLTTAEVGARLVGSIPAASLPPIQIVGTMEGGKGLADLAAGEPANVATPDHDGLAVVFFTSGSTGDPKGVMLSQRSLSETLAWVRRRDGLRCADRLMSHGRLNYFSLDLFLPLLGCEVFLLADSEAMFPAHVAERVEQERATLWSSTSTALRMLLEAGELERRNLSALRRVAFFGEPLHVQVLKRLMDILPQVEFVNRYGATEAYNMAYYVVPRPLPADLEAVPLGRPSDVFRLTIRDEGGARLPPGDVGEICVAGPTVMLGYWEDDGLTAEKRLAGQRDSYRTGDLGYLDSQGLLHFAGRLDHVVKLRGHRFDLGEIEAVLKSHPAVREAVAFVVHPVVKAAVLVEEECTAALWTELRRICHARLPSFARPADVTPLARFPLLSTGKVDRRALQRQLAEG